MTAIVCGNNVLTHDPQSDGVAGALSLGVGGETSIVACSVTCDTLQHQAVIAQYDSGRYVVVDFMTLRTKMVHLKSSHTQCINVFPLF